MDSTTKKQIGLRLRAKREQAGYTREQLGELCGLSPRFIANIELGDSTFSLDSLMNICHTLSCSSDFLLFGSRVDTDAWADTVARLKQTDLKYKESLDKALLGMLELIIKAERQEPSQ